MFNFITTRTKSIRELFLDNWLGFMFLLLHTCVDGCVLGWQVMVMYSESKWAAAMVKWAVAMIVYVEWALIAGKWAASMAGY